MDCSRGEREIEYVVEEVLRKGNFDLSAGETEVRV